MRIRTEWEGSQISSGARLGWDRVSQCASGQEEAGGPQNIRAGRSATRRGACSDSPCRRGESAS